MKFVNVRDLRNNTRSVLESTQDDDVVISINGKPQAILVGITEEELEDFIIVKHFGIESDYLSAIKNLKKGKLVPFSDAKKRLDIS